jgi:hypothetical protein
MSHSQNHVCAHSLLKVDKESITTTIVLISHTFFFHEISPESQKWIDENPIKFTNESPIQKVAFIVSTGLFE